MWAVWAPKAKCIPLLHYAVVIFYEFLCNILSASCWAVTFGLNIPLRHKENFSQEFGGSSWKPQGITSDSVHHSGQRLALFEMASRTHLNRDHIESNLSVPGIQKCHENALYKSFEKSLHLLCLYASTNIPLEPT